MRLAIIPARGGSKRIPRKNVLPFAGRPLMSYPLAAARESGLFDEVHVSTDDAEIATVAAAAGCPPRFLRAAELSDDTTGLLDVLRWVVRAYGGLGLHADMIALVYATAPLLTADDLRHGAAVFTAAEGRFPVMAVAEYPVPAQWAAVTGADGTLEFLDFAATQIRSQDLPKTCYDAAAFSLFGAGHLLDMPAEALRYLPYRLPRSRAVDIDTAEDLAFAESLFRFHTAGGASP